VKVALGIPYWDSGDEDRRKNIEWLEPYVDSLYPFIRLLSGRRPTNRGQARNFLVEMAADAGCDVIVLCDADTFPEKGALLNAIMGAQTHGGLHFAYDKFVALNPTGTRMLHMGMAVDERNGHGFRPIDYVHSSADGGLGGVMAVRPDEWLAIGGSPELTGWGFEDVIYAVKSRTLIRPNTHHQGYIYHLWHPTECRVGSEQYEINIAICKEYERADGNRDAILELEKKYGVV